MNQENDVYSITIKNFKTVSKQAENIFFALEEIRKEFYYSDKKHESKPFIIEKAYVIKNNDFIIDITDLVAE